ncbi:phosphoribosylformylglycinamidine cyclo-ligase [Bacteroidetes/Chlorobi group bacterium Naka2016]|jgi:phosphoribosylformylglycinamidine cyclo-ligase|nr:MAG: phosphoribosylformylglycinamidine cyclo-ligase [Bacteroidetes/Chlorobi group bacterium Naka2016]
MGTTYKQSGVDIEAGEKTVERIKSLVKSTYNERVLSEIGLFGGFYDAKFPEFEHPVLISSTDGVGTKLKIAFMMNKHDTIGQCLVNHCVNDILTAGAKPLFFLDYFAMGKLDVDVAYEVIKGLVIACKENYCALIGGETAEMPSFYAEGEYDISGTIVGVVEKSKIINGSKIASSDVLIGLASNGLHTNGYSLARKVLLAKYKIDQYVEELGTTLGEELLKIHKSYYHSIYSLVQEGLINGISHITGGGILGNTKRIIPNGLTLKVDWNSWEVPPIFHLIQKLGDVPEEEMRTVFNLGIGLILVVSKSNVDKVLNFIEGKEKYFIIGEVV